VGACAWGLVTVLVTAFGARADATTPPPHVIEYRGDTLTVQVVKAPLDEVLAEIARQSHAEIRGSLREPREITARFEDVPLSQALDRLLAGQNYALIYGQDGTLRAIPLLGGSSIGLAPSFSFGPANAGAASSSPGGFAALLTQPIPVTGPVAEALGSDTASLGQLASLWLQDSDPAIGAQSLRSGFKAVEATPDMRAATLDVANTYSDTDLANMFRSFAGARAEELLDIIASQTKVTEFRSKATTVLHQLRSGG
jgi:hypothetical protein